MRVLKALVVSAAITVTAVDLSGCVETGIMHEDARKLNAENPGSVYSGASWWAVYPSHIAGIPESDNEVGAISQNDVKAALDLDAACQEQAYHKTPDYSNAIGKGIVNGGISTGGGEAGFATQFKGADPMSYGFGGAIIGGISGGVYGAAKQEEGEKIAINSCTRDFVTETRARHPGRFEGVYPEPWPVDGRASAPVASGYQSTLRHVDLSRSPGGTPTVPLR